MRARLGPISWRAAPLGLLTVALVLLTASAAMARPAAEGREEGAAGADVTTLPDPYQLIVEASDASAARAYQGREQVTVMAGGVPYRQQVTVSHAAGDPATALLPTGGALVTALTSRFLPVVAGKTTMAGRPAYRVELLSPSGQRMATLWVDTKTCLPLGRTLYDSAGNVVRSSNYLSVHVAAVASVTQPSATQPSATQPSATQPSATQPLAAQPSVAPTSVPSTPALGTSVPMAGLAGMRDEGWAVPGQLSAGLSLFDIRTTGAGAGQVVHLSYTDGLTSLSVFEQRGRITHEAMQGWTARPLGGTTVWGWPSAPDQVSWAAAGRVFTVVSDDPGRLGAAVAGLPHNADRRSAGVVDRFRHGVHRIWGWVNPF